jgi:hypothetical protein
MRELVDAQYEVLLAAEIPDVAEHDRLSRILETRLPCADFEVTPELWSRYLVSVAIREYFRDGDWRKPLTTALRADPNLVLPVREGHPIRAFVPAPEPPREGPLPEGVAIRKDGVPISEKVPLDAVHLLQRHDGDGLHTEVVVGPADIPREFLQKPKLATAVRREKRKKAIHTWGTVGAATLVASGAAGLVVGLDAHRDFVDPATPEDELPGLIEKGKPAFTSGVVLLSAGATGAAVVWTIPW